MPHEHSQAEAVIRRLIEAMVDEPSQVRVTPVVPQESRDANARFIKWSLGVHPSDYGKLVGKLRVHRNALELIVEAMGAREDSVWLIMPEPPDEWPSGRKPPIPRALHFDAAPMQALIRETLALILDEPATITASQTREDFATAIILVTLKIAAKSAKDTEILSKPCKVDGEKTTLIASLWTLFRAIGRQQGVAVKIEEA